MTDSAATSANHPGLLLHDCYRLLRRCLRLQFADLGLSEAQWRVLSTVNRLPGISQTRLANLLGIGKAPLGALVDRLEEEELLRRTADDHDRRVNCLQLTERAKPLALQLRQRYQALEPVFLSGISDAELHEARQALVESYGVLARLDPRADAVSLDGLPIMMVIAGVDRLSGRLFDRQLKQLGFTRTQWLLLSTVSGQEGLTQKQLAEALHMKKAPFGSLVDDLESGGWVRREMHPEDRRSRQLFLTDACHESLDSLVADYERVLGRAMAGIGAQQIAGLQQTLTTLRGNLSAQASTADLTKLEKTA